MTTPETRWDAADQTSIDREALALELACDVDEIDEYLSDPDDYRDLEMDR